MPDTPIRVLHAAKSLGLGGTEKVMQLLTSNLDHQRFQVAVHSPIDGPRAAQIRRAGVATYVGLDLLETLRRFRPHIVHLHRAGWPEPALFRPIHLANVPVVVETNVFGHHDPTPDGERIDRTLFVSLFCARRFSQATDIPAEPPRYSVLYNPVDTDLFARESVPDRDFTRPAAARISRPDPGKWSSLALDMLPHLARRVPNFIFQVVGAIPEAVEFVRAHGLEQHIRFLDPLETDHDIAGFLDSASVLAHANDTGESFGLVIAEAMACALPVVTHPSQGQRDNAQLELVEHGVTGLVAETAEDYAWAVAHLFENPELARSMGRAGQHKAARLFRVQTIARQLESIYLELLERKGISHEI